MKTYCAVDPMPISELVGAENFICLIDIILILVNASISACKFPKSEKTAIVKPVLKGSLDPQSLNSYRPISNLSYVSKLLEYVILEQLTD